MRELTVRIRFLKACLGNVKDRAHADGRFLLPRTPNGAVMFLAQWHRANMHVASRILGRWHGDVKKILWDVTVDCTLPSDRWYRRWYGPGDKKRYVIHEAFFPGQVIGVNCVVPPSIPDEDLWALFRIAGQYKGLSPFQPGEFGHFEVVSIRDRRSPPLGDDCGEKGETTIAESDRVVGQK